VRENELDRVYASCGAALSEVWSGVPGRVQNQTDLSAVSRAVRGRNRKAYATYSTAWNEISTVSLRETVFLSGEVLKSDAG
jgi:hypothetical protein